MYVPKRSQEINIREWKGYVEVSPMPIMTIRSNDRTEEINYRESNTRSHMNIQYYDCTRLVIRLIYDLKIVLGYY